MNEQSLEQQVDPMPPTPMGYTVRIISPTDVVSTLEVRTYPTPEEASEALATVADKLTRNDIREYEIHLVDQTTGITIRTLKRKLSEGGSVYSNPTER